jgi:hypothetical protein
MERLAGFEPACTALEERCLNPLGHRRVVNSNVGTGVEDRTLLHLFVGEGLSTRKRPRYLAVGAGFEPAHELGNSQLPYHLATPQKLVGDLGFEPRFSWSQAKRVNPFP